MFVASPLLGHVDSWIMAACATEDANQHAELDPGVVSIANLLYASPRVQSMSTQVLCERHGMTVDRFRIRECRLACAILTAALAQQRDFEQHLARAHARGDIEVLYYVEFGRMDETPLPLRTTSSHGKSAPQMFQDPPCELALGVLDSRLVARDLQHSAKRPSKDRAPTNLMQLEFRYAYLLRWSSGGRGQAQHRLP